MDEVKLRCQSCGMPLDPGYFGTNDDSSQNREWCFLCFKQGVFKQPDLTLELMLETSVGQMMRHLGLTREKAEAMAKAVIPNLRRWKSD